MPITLAAATGCHGDEPAAPFSINADLHTGSEEGEFFGRLLLNGTPIADTGYTISLVPADPATASRLRYPDPTMWVNPAGYANSGNMWDFFDPKAGGNEQGVSRWAPRLATEIWAAQRTRGVNLVRQPRDVQLVLSADARTGSATFTVVLLRAANLAALQALADESLTRLDDGGSLR
jgi:hypothetical protein